MKKKHIGRALKKALRELRKQLLSMATNETTGEFGLLYYRFGIFTVAVLSYTPNEEFRTFAGKQPFYQEEKNGKLEKIYVQPDDERAQPYVFVAEKEKEIRAVGISRKSFLDRQWDETKAHNIAKGRAYSALAYKIAKLPIYKPFEG